MCGGSRAALAGALLTLAALAGVGGQGGGGGPSPAPRAPLGVQSMLQGVQKSITNWPQFAAANNLTGWGSDPSIPPCLWSGVTCDADGRLQSMCASQSWQPASALQCQGACQVKAEGTLPVSIASSGTLATLNIQGNALHGPLPPEYAAPGALPSLINLVVQVNHLSGSIPDEWTRPGAFPKLTLLGLGSNRLTGTIPEDLEMPALLILRANNNNLTGTLPPYWGSNSSLPRVRVLALHGNALTGTLPVEWGDEGTLGAVEELYLQDNQLTGPLPPEWGASGSKGLPYLRVLNLSDNPLSGTLPFQWSQERTFPELKTLALSNTGLEGTLPSSWDCQDKSRCGLAQLQTLWLDGNNFSGPVPPSWTLLSSLEAVFIRPGNELLCMPPSTDFPFRLCEAHDGVDCRVDATLPPCTPTTPGVSAPGAEHAVAAASGAGGADPTAVTQGSTDGGSSSSSGGDGVSVGAIVGGAVGGMVAAAAALAGLALALRRRRRKRKRERELPFYAEEAEKSSNERSLFGRRPTNNNNSSNKNNSSSLPPGPPPDPDTSDLRSSSDDPGPSLFLSPFAAMAGGGLSRAASGAPSEQQQGQQWGRGQLLQQHRSNDSSGSFLRQLMAASTLGGGAGAAGAAAAAAPGTAAVGFSSAEAAAAADRALDAEVERHMSLELAALGPSDSTVHTGCGPNAPSPIHTAGSMASTAATGATGTTAGTGGTGGARAADHSDESRGLQWEDSVPLSDWQITPQEIEIAKRPDGTDWELGTGGFGKVYKALRHGAQPVAVKVLASMGEARYQTQEDFRREIGILRACRDPNIVAFLGASLQPSCTMLVTEYCDGGNLTRNLMAGRVTWYRRGKKIALDVARGLTYLHSRRIIHFDLKSPNILLARDGTAKISDVGMAKIVAREYSGVTGNVGTLAWAAPEMLLGARCTEKADIYSYGVVLWEICTGQTPIRGQLRDVRVPEECPAEVRELILDCLTTNPRRRPSAVEVVERLRAMPDAPPTPSPQPAGRQPLPPALRPQQGMQAPPFGQLQNAGASASAAADPADAAALTAAPVAALHAAAAAAPQQVQRSGSQRRSTESDASFQAAVTFPTGRAIPAAYASPAPGSETAAAAARLAAASGAGAGAELRRAGSATIGTLPISQNQQRQQERLRQRKESLQRASSSPPWQSLPRPPLPASPSPATQPVAAPRGRHRPPLSLSRQRSLDDPTQQMAELQSAVMQLASSPAEEGSSSGHPGQQQQQQQSHPPVSGSTLEQALAAKLAHLQHNLRQQSSEAPAGEQGAAVGAAGSSLTGGQQAAQQQEQEQLRRPRQQEGQRTAEARLAQQGSAEMQLTVRTSSSHRSSQRTEQLASQHKEELQHLAEQQQHAQQQLADQQQTQQAELAAAQQAAQRQLAELQGRDVVRMETRHQDEQEQEWGLNPSDWAAQEEGSG